MGNMFGSAVESRQSSNTFALALSTRCTWLLLQSCSVQANRYLRVWTPRRSAIIAASMFPRRMPRISFSRVRFDTFGAQDHASLLSVESEGLAAYKLQFQCRLVG